MTVLTLRIVKHARQWVTTTGPFGQEYHRAQCTCGWVSPYRRNYEEAVGTASLHKLLVTKKGLASYA